MSNRNFFAELKRRNVYKVAVAYAVVGWLLIQIATQVLPIFEIPNWALRLIVFAIVIGFPIALVIAWAFELTPEGIKRTEVADALPTTTRQNKHAWIYIVIIGAAISVALFFSAVTRPEIIQCGWHRMPAKSIAVLPFDNLSEDKNNAFFAEGVQDEILTRLAKVADLKVISRTSTQSIRARLITCVRSQSSSASCMWSKAACRRRPIRCASIAANQRHDRCASLGGDVRS